MIAIQKTVTIPEDRRLSIDLPESFPVGTATLLFALMDTARVPPVETAFPAIAELKRQAAEKTARRKAEGRKPFDDLCGVLSGSPALCGDPVEMVCTAHSRRQAALPGGVNPPFFEKNDKKA